MVRQRGGKFGLELLLSGGDIGEHLLIFGQKFVGVVDFFLRAIRILGVEIVDGPVVAIPGGLFVL